MHILRSITSSGLLEVLSLPAPELEAGYEEMITEQKRVYSQVRLKYYLGINDTENVL